MEPKQTYNPQQAKQSLAVGEAVLIDIRGQDEYAREHIPGAVHVSLDDLEPSKLPKSGKQIIFHCKGGTRTAQAKSLLSQCTDGKFTILEGGIDAWKAARFETEIDQKQPLEMNRQVQITAGSLVLFGALMAFVFGVEWALISAFVGAGLVFAGVSGTCGMARLLGIMPWNRRTKLAS